jgi:hypothetical protein
MEDAMQKWEYRTLVSIVYDEDRLNRMGQEGWELVAVAIGGLEGSEGSYVQPARGAKDEYMFFKRPVVEKEAPPVTPEVLKPADKVPKVMREIHAPPVKPRW